MMLYVETRLYDLAPASMESSYNLTDMLHAFYVVPSGSDVSMHKFRGAGDALFGNKVV